MTPGRQMLFYPRISVALSTIRVFVVAGNGTRQEVFLLQGMPEVWSPISAQFELELPGSSLGPRRVEIELNGRGAQIWHKDQTIIF